MPTILRHEYTPRGTARELLLCRDREVLVSGPAGTGKSRACLEKLNLVALRNPGMRGLIVRKTREDLSRSALVTWREHVVKEALEAGKLEWYGGSSQEAAQYRYKNGSVINIAGMDKPTRIMSSEYDLIYAQEAIELSEEDWENLSTRLRNGVVSFQQIIADTNPDTPTHWLKVRCDSGKTTLFNSTHEENPRLFDEHGVLTASGAEYIHKLDNLTGTKYQRLRKGLWVAAEGIIYEEFMPSVHIIDRFDIPQDWRRFWTVDFGMVHPMVVQFWAQDPDGKLFLYREIFETGITIDEKFRDRILALVKNENGTWKEPKPSQIITDHQAQERAQFERQLGMGTVPANKDVINGIGATQVRFRDKRIFLMKDSVVSRDQKLVDAKKPASTIEEIPGYIWDTGAGKKLKEAPKKENDDGCDAMRYMVSHLDLRGRVRVRAL